MREKNILPIDYTSDIRKKQLQALFQLHANMGADKGLFNLQLAAAHISFMLQYSSETIVRSLLIRVIIQQLINLL